MYLYYKIKIIDYHVFVYHISMSIEYDTASIEYVNNYFKCKMSKWNSIYQYVINQNEKKKNYIGTSTYKLTFKLNNNDNKNNYNLNVIVNV